MNNLMTFEGNNVEVFQFGEDVLFNASDVAKCLDIVNVNKNITTMEDYEVKKLKNSDITNGDFRKLNNAGENFLTEAGVYSLVMCSRKPEAKEFKKWIVTEVLPSIRKHGAYATEETIDKMLNDPDFAIRLLTKLKEEKEARIEAERKNAILMHVNKTYTTTEIAKELNMRSAIELNKKLAEMKIQYKQNKTWVLYSNYSSCGYTEIKQRVLDTDKVVYDRAWTQLGRDFILHLFEENEAE